MECISSPSPQWEVNGVYVLPYSAMKDIYGIYAEMKE